MTDGSDDVEVIDPRGLKLVPAGDWKRANALLEIAGAVSEIGWKLHTSWAAELEVGAIEELEHQAAELLATAQALRACATRQAH